MSHDVTRTGSIQKRNNTMSLLDQIKEHSTKIFAVLIILFFAGGIGLGWYIKPDQVKIEEKLKLVEVIKEVVVVQEKVRVEVVKVKDVQVVERWHREKKEEKKPDGSVIYSEIEDRNIDSVLKEKENSVEVKVVEVEKQVIVEREKIVEKKIEPVLNNWNVGAYVGFAPDFSVLTNSAVVVGLQGSRRIYGPFWLGAYVDAQIPIVGVTTLKNPSLGVQFAIDL